MSGALASMIEALGLEVDAIRKTGGGNQIELRGGERIRQVGRSWLYRFVVADDLNLRDETPVRVTAGVVDVAGMLVSFREGVMLVSLEQDLGATLPTARLITNDAFLVERLKMCLEEVRGGDTAFNLLAADRVVGVLPPRSADADPDPLVLVDGMANSDQVCAVRRSLGSDVVFVWGPPGTGKTTTLARIVEAHFRAGRSVLLVSNTNIAVDTALERVAERLKGETEFHLGLVIRHGPIVKEELRQRFGAQVVVEEIVARLGEDLRSQHAQLSADAGPIEAEERLLQSQKEQFERLAALMAACASLEDGLRSVRTSAAIRQREYARHREEAKSLRADLVRAMAMNALRRFFSGLDTVRLEGDALAAEQRARAARSAAEALEAEVARFEVELQGLRRQAEGLQGVTHELPPLGEVQARLGAVQNDLTRIHLRREEVERELAELEEQVVARCRVMATTVYRTYLGSGLERQFDAVVIDEASMLMPPLVYYAAGLATHAVTVAGDFRQLPPIVRSEEPLALEWLKQDVFEKAGIASAVARGEPIPHLVTLGTQYRMREPICDVINDLFYVDHPLRSHPSVNHGGVGAFGLASSPVLYVDSSRFRPWAAYPVGTYSRYNLIHALLIRNLVTHLAETGFLPPVGEPNDAVGIVSPYAAQARLIQSMLDDQIGARAIGMAATVHRFQGNEKSVMMLDLTDSFGAPLGRFMQAVRVEEDGARLLNVAVSRAKHHVILIANFPFLRAKAPSDAIIRRLLAHFEDHGEPLNVDDVVPRGERDWFDALRTVVPTSFEMPVGAAGAFTEANFYPAFLYDLNQARESVVILSPFATNAGTSRYVEPLRAALARGVRVRIVTRPPPDPEGGSANVGDDVVAALRDLGFSVDLRDRMHEKIAIVDGRILWHGSLNVLSHRDTHESMLRIDSDAACDQLGRFLSAPGRGRRDEPVRLEAVGHPPCPTCGGPTVGRRGTKRLEFVCERSSCRDHARGRGPRSDTTRVSAGPPEGAGPKRNGDPCPRTGCGGRLRARSGRYGAFFGCSNYPECRFTVNG